MMIGKHVVELETPALVIDFDKLDRNIARMADYVKKAGCSLRPHFKTSKCPAIAHRQIKAGAIGITCAKLGEAEVLVNSGIDNILIANQVIEKSKILRLAGMAKYSNIMVAAEDIQNIENLSEAADLLSSKIGILIEVDIGMGRCGARDKEAVLRLAEKTIKSKGLVFKGIMGYEGHCVFIEDTRTRCEKTHDANSMLVEYKDFLEAKGFNVEIVSSGGTGTYQFTSNFEGITEIQAGSYVFMDGRYCSVSDIGFENSLFMLSTVISRPSEDIVITDTGMKAITHEFGMPKVMTPRGLELKKLAEEHGILKTEEGMDPIHVGDKIKIIPSHCCTTVNLHDRYYVISNDIVIGTWNIEARGKFC